VSEETCALADGVEICFERFGDPADPAMLLVMGLGTQMLGWNEEFCTALADRGFHVIRFDNRDIGRSTYLRDLPVPRLRHLIARRGASYSLSDMAADAVGLLDHLEIERAHVVGASMGGMIAQTMAFRRPERVLSLVSIMSNTGALLSGQPRLHTYSVLLGNPPKGREEAIEHTVKVFKTIGSPGFPRDEAALRQMAGLSYDRGRNPAGAARQLAAIIASGDRREKLATITAPTLVIHGTADPLVRPSGGRATAKAIPGARLLLIEGMGHDLPHGAWPQVIDGIVENAARTGAPAAASA
jgi:pimeloyl-ACP methyl ester carboxylesterase